MTEKRQRILELWNSFLAKTYPSGIPNQEQRDQVRRAFFAGAVATFSLCVGGEGIWLSEEDGMKVVSELQEEFDLYLEKLKRSLGTPQ